MNLIYAAVSIVSGFLLADFIVVVVLRFLFKSLKINF